MDQRALVIGFAFSLMPDGSAGPHNLKLAEWLFQEMKDARISVSSGLALQWEIAEAIEVLSSNALEPWRELGNLLVIAPPRFAPGDVNGAKLRGHLAVSSLPFATASLKVGPSTLLRMPARMELKIVSLGIVRLSFSMSMSDVMKATRPCTHSLHLFS